MSEIPPELRRELEVINETAAYRLRAARDKVVHEFDQHLARGEDRSRADLQRNQVRMRQHQLTMVLAGLGLLGVIAGVVTTGVAVLWLIALAGTVGIGTIARLSYEDVKDDRKEITENLDALNRKRRDLLPKPELGRPQSAYESWGLDHSEIEDPTDDRAFAAALSASRRISPNNDRMRKAVADCRDEIIATALATVQAFQRAGVAMPDDFPLDVWAKQAEPIQDTKRALDSFITEDLKRLEASLMGALAKSTKIELPAPEVQSVALELPQTPSRDIGMEMS